MNFWSKKCSALAFLAILLTVSFISEAWAGKKIGVLVWNEEPRYADTIAGMEAQLAKEGFAPPEVSFVKENAGGNKAKAVEISKKFAESKYDLILVLGTSAAVPLVNEVKDTPVVFGMIFDPVDAKIAASWESSGNNTTGVSAKVPMSQLVDRLKMIAPVKTLGITFTPNEKNSEAQLREMQAAATQAQIKVFPIPLSAKSDVASVLPNALPRVDALYLTGSNIVGESLETIVAETIKAKVITLSHLQDHVEKGALWGMVANSRMQGELAGGKAAQILKGAAPSSIPIETLKNLDVLLNAKTAKASGITIPQAFRQGVTREIQ